MINTACARCKRNFEAHSYKAVYCGAGCRNAAYRERKRAEVELELVAAKSGRTLVGSIPAIGVPGSDAAPYNAVISDVAAMYHAQLVDLSPIRAQEADTPQHRSIAAAFEAALAHR